MSFRLYESAWVVVDGVEEPVHVHKDRVNPAVFHVGEHLYDIDARPVQLHRATPRILSILSLSEVRDAGLRSGYDRDIDPAPLRADVRPDRRMRPAPTSKL